MEELQTIVVYDISDDRIRNRLGEACKDYGLKRVQFSGFLGPLSRNMRQELCLRLKDELGERPGKILVQPICEKDAKEAFVLEVEKAEDESEGCGDDTPESQ